MGKDTMRRIIALSALACALAAPSQAADLPSVAVKAAEAPLAIAFDGLSAGPVFGTLGVGVEAGYRFGGSFGVRGQVTGFPLRLAFNDAVAPYSAMANYLSAGVLADYYPLGPLAMVRVTGGLRYANNNFTLISHPATVTLNGITYTAAQVGALTSNVRYNSATPYLGIGLETPPTLFPNFVVGLDLGANFLGTPATTLTSSNNLIPASSLSGEQANIQAWANRYHIYPVAEISLKYKF